MPEDRGRDPPTAESGRSVAGNACYLTRVTDELGNVADRKDAAVLLISIGLWCVVVYSVRVAAFGNPLFMLLTQADPNLLRHCEAVSLGEAEPASEEELKFLQLFSRLTLLELAAFILEMSLLAFLWVSNTVPWLTFALLLKNVLLLALSVVMARSRMGDGLFRSLLDLPPWVVWLDRASGLISACGVLILFLEVNDLLAW